MSAVLEKQPDVIAMESGKLVLDLPVSSEMQRLARPAGALAVAQAYEVDCPEMAQSLADERIIWARRIDAIEVMEKDFMSPVKRAVEDMKAKVQKWFGPTKADYAAARELAGQKLLAWDQQEKARVAREQAERDAMARRLRHEAEAKAAAELARAQEAARQREAEARAAAEARARAEAAAKQAAEEKRIAQEAGDKGAVRAAAEAERKANEEARSRAAAEAKANEQAVAAVANGVATAARVQTEAAAAASAQPLVQEATKIAGQSTKENWVAVLKDGETAESALEKIVAAIAGVPVITGRRDLLAHLALDTAPRGSLNRQAAAQKAHMSVPGFRAENQPLLAGKRK